MSTITDLFENVGKAQANLTKVEGSLFDVVKMQLHPNLEGFTSPEAFGIYKGTGGAPLGVMGSQFEPMQPKELLQNIIHTSHESGADLKLETLKFNEYKGGSVASFTVDLEPIVFTNAAGAEDVTETKLVFSTSYNGSQSNQISFYTFRQICTNGMMGWGLDATLKGKNTTGGKNKILTYGSEVMKIVSKSEEYKDKLVALNKIKVGKAAINAYLSKLLGYDVTETGELSTKARNILDRINESVGLEFSRTGQTYFGLLNGITHYTNHIANTSKTASNEEYILFAQGAKTNELAQKLAFAELN